MLQLVLICVSKQQNEDKDGKQDPDDDDDEKQRILSMVKTAIGFFLVPLALFTLFGMGDSNNNSLERDKSGKIVGEVNWHDFYHNLLTKVRTRTLFSSFPN